MDIRNLTESQAIEKGLTRDSDLNVTTSHCPECGCPWSGNVNTCGPGHRLCGDCYQDWYTGIDYGEPHELRELPGNLTIDNCIEYLNNNYNGFSFDQYEEFEELYLKIMAHGCDTTKP